MELEAGRDYDYVVSTVRVGLGGVKIRVVSLSRWVGTTTIGVWVYRYESEYNSGVSAD